MDIYYQPHKSRKKEAAFVHALIEELHPNVVEGYYPLPESLLHRNVHTADIINWVDNSGISTKRQHTALQELSKCPSEIRVALTPNQITCDVVILQDNTLYYFEYHEKQHARLTINRPSTIYALDGTPITVPRFIQRLVRDVWRTLYLRPYTVVWDDYFNEHGISDIAELKTGYCEYYLPEKPNFTHFV